MRNLFQIEGCYPFPGEEKSRIKTAHRAPVVATDVERELLSRMLSLSPQERIDIESLREHPYVAIGTAEQHQGQGDC